MFDSIQTTSIWITWTIVHFIWMGICIWFVAQLFKLCLSKGRPATIYRINLIGLLALILCFPLSASIVLLNVNRSAVAIPIESTTIADSPDPFNEPTWPQLRQVEQPTTLVSPDRPESAGIQQVNPIQDRTSVSVSHDSFAETHWLVRIKGLITGLAPFVAGLYFVGVVFMLARLLFMFVGCHKIQRGSTIVQDAKIVKHVSALARRIGLRVNPTIRLTTQVATPVVVGIFKPMLLIPGCIVTGMTVDELDSILIHELAHLKRLDHIVVLIQRVAEAVFFFHPVVWHFSRQLSRTRELCCDDVVIAQGTSPLDYARSLCRIAELSSVKNKPAIANAATGENPNELIARVRRVLGESSNVRIGPSRTAILALAILILSPFFLVQGFSALSPSDAPTNINVSTPDQDESTTKPASTITNANLDAQDSAAAADSRKAYNGEASKPYSISGIVIDKNGQPLPAAVIRCCDDLINEQIIAADSNGNFRVDLTCKYTASLIAQSADKTQIGILPIKSSSVLELSSSKVEIKLDSAIPHKVRVTKNGQPVQNAFVISQTKDSWQNLVSEKTDSQGLVEVLLPQDKTLRHICAWHESLGMGICKDYDPTISDFEIELLPTRAITVQVVDENDKPVVNEPVNVSVDIKDSDFTLSNLQDATRNTDANGRVEFIWNPASDDFQLIPSFFGSENYDWDVNKTFTTQTPRPGGEFVLFAKTKPKKIPFRGRLVGDDKLGGIRVSFEGIGESLRDGFQVKTDETGEFNVMVIPGITYGIGVVDEKWASDLNTVVVDPDHDDRANFELDVYPATEVTINMTAGQDERPVVGGELRYKLKKKIQIGRQSFAYVGVKYEKTSDENGQLVIGSAGGQIELTATSQNWNETKTILVERGKPMQVTFHAPALGARMVTGRITGPSAANLDQCEVKLFDRYYGTKILPVKTNPDGSWNAEIDCHMIAVRVLTADKKFGGLAFDDNVADQFSPIKLKPTVSVSGTLVDEAGKPMPNAELIQYYESGHSNPRRHLRYLSTNTDTQGQFKFDSVLTGIPQKLSVKIPTGGVAFVGNVKVYQPGENVSDLNVVYVDYLKRQRNAKIATSRKSEVQKAILLKDQISAVTKLARAGHMHVLLTFASTQENDSVKTVIEDLHEFSEDALEILNFVPRTMFAGKTISDQSKKLLVDLGVEAPKDHQILCLITDHEGKKLEAKTFEVESPELKTEFREFLRRNLPPKRDARKLLDAATQKARDEGKQVFVKIGGPRCGPCLKMGAWMEEFDGILTKDYVMVNFHPGRCDNGVEVAEQLYETFGGVPWFTILDAEGKELINSEGPLGNVGFPIGGSQETDHFLKMITETRKQITDEEIEELRKSLSTYEYP